MVSLTGPRRAVRGGPGAGLGPSDDNFRRRRQFLFLGRVGFDVGLSHVGAVGKGVAGDDLMLHLEGEDRQRLQRQQHVLVLSLQSRLAEAQDGPVIIETAGDAVFGADVPHPEIQQSETETHNATSISVKINVSALRHGPISLSLFLSLCNMVIVCLTCDNGG